MTTPHDPAAGEAELAEIARRVTGSGQPLTRKALREAGLLQTGAIPRIPGADDATTMLPRLGADGGRVQSPPPAGAVPPPTSSWLSGSGRPAPATPVVPTTPTPNPLAPPPATARPLGSPPPLPQSYLASPAPPAGYPAGGLRSGTSPAAPGGLPGLPPGSDAIGGPTSGPGGLDQAGLARRPSAPSRSYLPPRGVPIDAEHLLPRPLMPPPPVAPGLPELAPPILPGPGLPVSPAAGQVPFRPPAGQPSSQSRPTAGQLGLAGTAPGGTGSHGAPVQPRMPAAGPPPAGPNATVRPTPSAAGAQPALATPLMTGRPATAQARQAAPPLTGLPGATAPPAGEAQLTRAVEKVLTGQSSGQTDYLGLSPYSRTTTGASRRAIVPEGDPVEVAVVEVPEEVKPPRRGRRRREDDQEPETDSAEHPTRRITHLRELIIAAALVVVLAGTGLTLHLTGVLPTNRPDPTPTGSTAESTPTLSASPGQLGATQQIIGRPFVNGDLTMTVQAYTDQMTEIGQDAEGRPYSSEKGQFVVVEVEVTNNGEVEHQFIADGQAIRTDLGHTFTNELKSAYLLPDNMLGRIALAPGVPQHGYLVFDIGADEQPIALEFAGDAGTSPVTIPLG